MVNFGTAWWAPKILADTINDIKSTTNVDSLDFDQKFISQLYKNRTDYVNILSSLDANGKADLAGRYVSEQSRTLDMLSGGN